MGDFYILDADGTPVRVLNAIIWGEWFRTADRVVARTEINKNTYVSTVFLGIDHNFFGSGDPVLWETMIFGGGADGYQKRYTSREDALAGHELAVLVANGETTEEAVDEMEDAL